MKCPKCGGEMTVVDEGICVCNNCNSKFKYNVRPKTEPASAPQTTIPAQNGGNAQRMTSPAQRNGNAQQTAPAPATANQTKSVYEIRNSAHQAISGHYGFAILTSILLNIVKYGSILFTAIFGPLLVGGMTKCSLAGFYLDVANGKQTDIRSTFKGFKYLGKSIAAQLLLVLIEIAVLGAIVGLLIAFIVSVSSFSNTSNLGIIIGATIALLFILIFVVLLFIVAIVDNMTFYVMMDRDDLTATQCVGYASRLVFKNFGKIILLNLSFIGWLILSILTFGILLLFVDPYYRTARAKMYLELKNTASTVG